jgi:hypothetical protein
LSKVVQEHQGSRIDPDNSSSVELGAGGTFTGKSVDVGQYTTATLLVFSDVDSAADGVKFQSSTDGVNWDYEEVKTYTGGTGAKYDYPLVGQYFRLVYVNGGTLQGAFRLQLKLHKDASEFMEIDAGTVSVTFPSSLTVDQATHDNLNANANLQVGDADVSTSNPVPVEGPDADGAVITGNPLLMGAEDSSNQVQNLQCAPDGDLITHVHTASTALTDNVSNTIRIPVNETDFGFYTTPVFPWVFDGTTWDRMRGDATNGLLVNLGSNNDVTQATHDNLNANANMQVGDADVSTSNPVPVDSSKVIDDVVGATDTGVALLAKHMEDQVHLTSADGDYDILTLDSLGSLHVNAESHHIFDNMEATTGWTALDGDTANIATTTSHVLGTLAITFDKLNTAANNTLALIEKTVPSTDLGDVSPHDIIQTIFYASSTADIDKVVVRLGTDSSNYNEWDIPGENLTQGDFEVLAFVIGDASFANSAGNGWDQTAITYIAVGVRFNAENNTLSGIIFDQLSYHTNQHTTTSLNAEVSSSVSSPNVKVNGWSGSVDTNTGNASNGTLRVVVATDQPRYAVDGNMQVGDVDVSTSNPVPVGGDVAHDAADAGNPIKIGGKVETDVNGPTAVADADRVNAWFSAIGQMHTLNHGHMSDEIDQTALETTYGTTTSANGADIDPKGYRTGTVMVDFETSLGTPTRIQFKIQAKDDGGTYYEAGAGFWQALEYEDLAIGSGVQYHFPFKVPECTAFRFRVEATGTDASNTFDITTFKVRMRT